MSKPPVEGWERVTTEQLVHIPTPDGSGVAETRPIEVEAWRDPATGEIYLDGHATEAMEAVKARYMGVLTPAQLRELRRAIGVNQKEMAGLLQLGEKSWTRWETGRERPSRSTNVLLCALYDGKVDVQYLEQLAQPSYRSQIARWAPAVRLEDTPYRRSELEAGRFDESTSFAA